MNDEFYNKSSRNSNGKNPQRHGDNFYQEPITQEELDSIFSSRADHSKNNSQNKFKVSIPEEKLSAPGTQKDRVPKGKPVGSAGYAQSVPPQRAQRTGGPYGQNGYHQNDVPSYSRGAQQTNNAGVNRSVQGKTPVYARQTQNGAVKKATPPQKTSARAQNAGVSSSSAKNRRKKTSGGKKAAIAVLCTVLVLLGALFAYGYSILGKINYDNKIIEENPYISESKLATDSQVKNILFIGSDARSEIAGMRSDTMILFSIDTKNKKIKLTSFLRDSYVCIPSTGNYRKLNAACSSGGAQLVIDTIEYNFKTKIDSYVLVDFEVFTKFIDLLGGLDVPDVSAAEAKYLRDKVKIVYAKEGDNHFSGAATLWYCRIRYLDNDFKRTERQRKVISAIINQVSHTSPTKLFSIVEEIMPMITTDISRNELLSLAMGAAFKYLRYDIVQHQIPADGTWSNAKVYGVGDVLKMDIDENAKLLEEFLYSEDKE